MTNPDVNRLSFVNAMRRVPSAVAVVSMSHDGHRGGLTATAVCSVSADPPQILVCINKAGRTHESLRSADSFAVNYLAHDQHGIARNFSSSTLAPEERFAGAQWTEETTDVPLLADAMVAFKCRVAQAVDCGTHTIFIGRITEVHQRDERALLYKSGEFISA